MNATLAAPLESLAPPPVTTEKAGEEEEEEQEEEARAVRLAKKRERMKGINKKYK